mgnify:CR=1 FL=1
MNKKSYPQHKFSKYIDMEFSFNNTFQQPTVDIDDVLQDMKCDGDIMLEPRLQEYLRKRKFYKDHPEIEDYISPEQEYQISDRDRRILRQFLSGNTNIYNSNTVESYEKKKNSYDNKKYFPSKAFRDDPRVSDIERYKKENEAPINRGMFYPEKGESYYEGPTREINPMMDSRDIVGFSLDEQYNTTRKNRSNNQKYGKSDPRNNYIMSDLIDDSERIRNNSGVPMSSGIKSYSNIAEFNNNGYSLMTQEEKDNYSRQNGYGKLARNTYSEKSTMDTNNKVVIPNISQRSDRDLNTSEYHLAKFYNDPLANDSNSRCVDLETEMIRGMPQHTSKSYGYKNPSENYYQYDVQDQYNDYTNSLVNPWPRGGVPTRNDNRTVARPRTNRDIM